MNFHFVYDVALEGNFLFWQPTRFWNTDFFSFIFTFIIYTLFPHFFVLFIKIFMIL